jgi:hypothetical protein
MDQWQLFQSFCLGWIVFKTSRGSWEKTEEVVMAKLLKRDNSSLNVDISSARAAWAKQLGRMILNSI